MADSFIPLTDVPGPVQPFDVNVDPQSFEKLQQWQQQYGDLVAIVQDKRPDPALLLNHPDHVRQVLIGNHRNYIKGVGFERVAMLLGNGIIVSDGAFWQSQRRMIQPAFQRSMIASLAVMMQRCNQRKLEQWLHKADRQEPINLTEEMSELALEVVLRALFSDDLDRMTEQLGHNPFAMLVEDVTRDLRLAMRFRALTRHVAKLIEQRRREARIEPDFLSLLMQARDKNTGEAMPDKALIDEVMTMIVAGHETTAGTLNWAWYLIATHPEIEQQLHAEADALARQMADSDAENTLSFMHNGVPFPGYDHLPNLSLTRRILDETLRLYPPVWLFSRKALAEDQFQSSEATVQVPPGTDIFLSPYLMHRDARFWPDPHRFIPDRFADEHTRERNRFVYYPFSLGSRRCIGEFFSLVDMQLHLGTLAHHLRLSHIQGQPVEIEPLVNLRSRYSIMMLPERRR